jgi:glycosyltransferase involved in cell wall biosynthesis
VPFLKNVRFGVRERDANRGGTALPYRIDHLVRAGIALHYTDAPYRRLGRRLPDPVVQTLRLAPSLLTADVVLAMFESSAHPFGLLRHHLAAARRARLAVISCWLPELLAGASPAHLDRYRKAYEHVDLLYFFSRNQSELLADLLGLPADRLRWLPFGIDHEEFQPTDTPVEDHLLAVGRDRGRDWPTLFQALAATGMPAKVLCRPAEVRGLTVPPNVEILGYVDRATYRQHLHRARLVLVVTHVLGYPTGQSVLLEAMASARPCVVTDSPAIRDYVDPGVTALTVPAHDADALAETLRSAIDDAGRLEAIGRAGRAAVESSFNAAHMWSSVASDLRDLTGRDLKER